MTGRLRPGGRTVKHPARYSPEVTTLFRFLLGANTRVHDPFAGTGERLAEVGVTRNWRMTGTEIEAEFIVERWVRHGDACDPTTYPPVLSCPTCGRGDEVVLAGDRCQAHHLRGFVIVTSPVYPNGIADSWKAKDGSRRRTYRTALAETTGTDRELHEHNQGRWGYRHGVFSTERQMYWHIARKAVACWGDAERVLVNVSDNMAGDRVIPVVAEWRRLLEQNGWRDIEAHEVTTKRFREGANRDARVDHEVVLDCTRWVQ